MTSLVRKPFATVSISETMYTATGEPRMSRFLSSKTGMPYSSNALRTIEERAPVSLQMTAMSRRRIFSSRRR